MNRGFELFLFSCNPGTLRRATAGGDAGAIVDWEHIGKLERQRGVDTQINWHTVEDLRRARSVVATTLICRLNGLGAHTRPEVEQAILAGADELMLPMVRRAADVQEVLDYVAGRCKVSFLVETRDAVARIDTFAELPVSRVYLGLFDLSIERRTSNLFAPLIDGTLERVRAAVRAPFGFGGLTLPECGAPIPCRLLLGEMVRLGCDFSFLRRSFMADTARHDAGDAVRCIARAIAAARLRSEAEVARDRAELVQRVRGFKGHHAWTGTTVPKAAPESGLFVDSVAKPKPGALTRSGLRNRSTSVLLMYPPSPAHLQALQCAAPGARIASASDEETARALIAEADAVLGNRYFLQSLSRAERLAWMQSNSMGVDLLVDSAAKRRFVLTNTRGVYDDEVADHALALVLALVRGIPGACEQQSERRWQRQPLRPLRGLRALVLGFGGIGRSIAQRLHGFGVEVTAVRRRAGGHAGGVAVCSDPEAWRAELERTDLLILALPKTPLTLGLVSTAELGRLPRGALVVNVGRGGTLDEAALLAALHRGRLAGAALDVFEQEPLAPESPLWTEPGILLTAHLGRSPEQPPYRWEGLFVENLRRFAAGEPLLNVVDHEAGY